MKLSDAKCCCECETLVEKEVQACPCCTGRQFFFPVNYLKSLKDRAEVDEARRRLKVLKETA